MNPADDACSPGSHPHSDRPNWRPAETIDEYLTNCREGLEEYSDRRAAKLLGVPRATVWRWKLAARIPEALRERIFAAARAANIEVSTKMLAHIGQALTTGIVDINVECCPNCGHVLRVRKRVADPIVEVVNQWISEHPTS